MTAVLQKQKRIFTCLVFRFYFCVNDEEVPPFHSGCLSCRVGSESVSSAEGRCLDYRLVQVKD